MIDMQKRQERVQWSVDGCCHAVFTEGGERVVTHHLVFVLFASVQFVEALEAFEIEKRKPGLVDRADIPATAFHGEHAGGLAGERIRKVDLGAGVATAEI